MQKILDALFSVCVYLALFLIALAMTLATADEVVTLTRIIGALIVTAFACHFFATIKGKK